MYCKNCGAQVLPEHRFCTNCGAKLPDKEYADNVPVTPVENIAVSAADTQADSDSTEVLTGPITESRPVYGADLIKSSGYYSDKKGTKPVIIVIAVIAAVLIVGISLAITVKNLFGSSKNKDDLPEFRPYELPDSIIDQFDGDITEPEGTFEYYDPTDTDEANSLAMDDYNDLIYEITDAIEGSAISYNEKSMLFDHSRANIWDLDDDGIDEFIALYSANGKTVRFVISRYSPFAEKDRSTAVCSDDLVTYDDPDNIWAAICTAVIDGKDLLAVSYEDSSIENYLSTEILYYSIEGGNITLTHNARAVMRTDTESVDGDCYYFDDKAIDYDTWLEVLDSIQLIEVEFGEVDDAAGVSFSDFAF